MKNILILVCFVFSNYAFAGTGSARDEWFMSAVLIGFLCLILLLIYLVAFLKRRLKNRKSIADTQELRIQEQEQEPEKE